VTPALPRAAVPSIIEPWPLRSGRPPHQDRRSGGRIAATVYLLTGIMLAYDEGPALGHVRGSAAVIYLAILAPASAGLLRAGAWSAAIFALAVIVLAGAGLLAWRGGTGGSFGIVLPVRIIVLNAALASLGMVQYHRKVARGSGAAAGIAGTREQHGQPTR